MVGALVGNGQEVDTVGVQKVPLQDTWGEIEYKGAPWVKNLNRKEFTYGLSGRHMTVWASHGRYYDIDKGIWKWQRPLLFGTVEDLYTQTIVIPYLIPMLENAGAYVFTPRERDWQKNEVIVDNEAAQLYPRNTKYELTTGFKMHEGTYTDRENPFVAGTAMILPTVQHQKPVQVKYTAEIPESGRYAVYVSYPKVEDAVEDVEYTVYHSGIATKFSVNQTMGYGTWVYLGSFWFSKYNEQHPDLNCIVVSNRSDSKGHIGLDAIRIGGGMGNIERGGTVSGYARTLEGARYYGQWAGAPYEVYCSKNGESDYGDDINVRSHMQNWLNGGSIFNPDTTGLKVPLELSLAVHSDAGYNRDGRSVHGTLAIATTNFNNGSLATPLTRNVSYSFARQLYDNMEKDMSHAFGTWNKRKLVDKNYSETRIPTVPSAIIETLSHQSFPDMKIGQHPYGKFQIARSLYKTILKYESRMHDKPYVVQPLPPRDFALSLRDSSMVVLTWDERLDDTEETARPQYYRLYTALDDYDFDNGQDVGGKRAAMRLEAGHRYRFKVTACNSGGESMSTNTLSAYVSKNPQARMLVVDGFERLSAPFIIDNDTLQGFDMSQDEGVQMGMYPGWSGPQLSFDKSKMGSELKSGLGYSSNDWAGTFFAGNNMDIAAEHVESIASTGKYTVVSCSLKAFEKGLVNPSDYQLIDFAFGLQKEDGQLDTHFKTLSPQSQLIMKNYMLNGGSILISGSYTGSDMSTEEDKQFADSHLKYCYAPADSLQFGGEVKGLGTSFEIYCRPNALHYAASHPEMLSPVGEGFPVMTYDNGGCAAVAYKGEKYASMTIGFPIECITDKQKRNSIMSGILTFLLL